jgi:dienelactone hydrolase
MRNVTSLLALLLLTTSIGRAAVQTETVTYRRGDVTLEGVMMYDPTLPGSQRPAVLVVHQWMGLTDYEKRRCRMLAEMGYVAFAVDIYGKGVRPKSTAEAGKLAGQYKADRALLRSRVTAGLEILKANQFVDPKRIAAIGYCFGGTTVLELARSGADVAGVVSFHGGLSTPTPAEAHSVKAKVLVLHGADDPFVPPAEVAGFQEEMRKAGADWQFVAYSGAVHGFTQAEAGSDNSKGAAYNEKADRRSWQAMNAFFAEVLGH